MGLSTKEGTFVMTYESITPVRLGKMVSFTANITVPTQMERNPRILSLQGKRDTF